MQIFYYLFGHTIDELDLLDIFLAVGEFPRALEPVRSRKLNLVRAFAGTKPSVQRESG